MSLQKKRKASSIKREKVVPKSPLYQAIVGNDCVAINELLEIDATLVSQKFTDSHYPITLAALKGSAAVVSQLLTAGADTQVYFTEYKKTFAKFSCNAPHALQLASTRPDGADIIRTLYKHDSVGRGTDNRWLGHSNPLVWAAVFGRAENITALHECGAKVNAEYYQSGRTPINMAIEMAPLDALLPTLTALVQAGETLQKGVDSHEDPALHWAASRRADMSNVVNWLVQSGCDVNYILRGRRIWQAPLHVAALDGSAETMCALLKQGADVNLQTNEGRTALHLAVTDQDFEKMRPLIEAGADCAIKDGNGKTAIDYVTLGSSQDPLTGIFMMCLDDMDQFEDVEYIDTGRLGRHLARQSASSGAIILSNTQLRHHLNEITSLLMSR